MTTNSSRPSPWYREPLVWLVFAIPAAAVVAGAVMLVLANVTWDGLVADDYYRRGMQINRSLARDAEAERLGLRASVTFPAPGLVEARLAGAAGAGTALGGGRLHLRFARAARAGADVTVTLTRSAGGVWRGVLPEMAPGKWYAELGDERWRLTAPARMPAATGEIVLRASQPGGGVSSSSVRMRTAGVSRSSNWPERTAHTKIPAIATTATTEIPMSSGRISIAVSVRGCPARGRGEARWRPPQAS